MPRLVFRALELLACLLIALVHTTLYHHDPERRYP